LELALSQGAAAYAAGRLAEAAAAYRRAERVSVSDVRATYSLAIIDIRQGQLRRARERLLGVAQREPGLFGAWHNLGFVSQSLGLWPEAADAYRRALGVDPAAVTTTFDLAIACSVVGRIDEAAALYRSLLPSPATHDRALSRLAILAPHAITDDELIGLRRAAQERRNDAEPVLHFAIAGVLEARNDDDAAFAAFAEGNALKRAQLCRSANPSERPEVAASQHEQAADFVKTVFTPSFLAEHASLGGASRAAPIFIVGMPRSGSSLIEQVLSAHPLAQGMGESPSLSDVVNRPALEQSAFSDMAESYLARLEAFGWSRSLRPVDKTLENYLHVGLIHLMFPRAVILHSVRDPVDTCVSCYRQLFAAGNETLYDLGDIGAEYVRYRSVMEHWNAVLPGRVIDVEHEALVASPQTEIRRLVTDRCALEWDPVCLRFHEAPAVVRTASAAQVRQPIFHTSIQRWRRYASHLDPLLAALGPYAGS